MNLQTIRSAAATTGVSESIIRRAVCAGKIDSLQLGNRRLIDVDKVGDSLRGLEDGITTEELSRETGLAMSAIRRGVKAGWLPGWKGAHGTWRFDLEEAKCAIRQKMQSRTKSGRG